LKNEKKEYANVYKIRGKKRNKLKVKLFQNSHDPLKVKLYTSLLEQQVYNFTKKVISRKYNSQLYIDVD